MVSSVRAGLLAAPTAPASATSTAHVIAAVLVAAMRCSFRSENVAPLTRSYHARDAVSSHRASRAGEKTRAPRSNIRSPVDDPARRGGPPVVLVGVGAGAGRRARGRGETRPRGTARAGHRGPPSASPPV